MADYPQIIVRRYEECILTGADKLRSWFERMQAEGTYDSVFYDGEVRFVEDMRDKVLSGHIAVFCISVLVGDQEIEAAVGWVDDYRPRTARAHFVTFKEFWGGGLPAILVGKALWWLLNLKGKDGAYIFDSIRAELPVCNHLARKVISLIGFKRIGNIPQGAYVAAQERSVDMIVYFITRQEARQWADQAEAVGA